MKKILAFLNLDGVLGRMDSSFRKYNPNGYDSKKLSAWYTLAILITGLDAGYIDYAMEAKDFSLLPSILISHFGFAASAFAIHAYGQKTSNGGADGNGSNTTSPTDTLPENK